MVEATIRANEKKAREDKAEDRQRIRRVEKGQVTAQRELERAGEGREQERTEKRLSVSTKKRRKRFEAIAKLPRVAQEARLAELAKRLDEDLELLRDEFAAFWFRG